MALNMWFKMLVDLSICLIFTFFCFRIAFLVFTSESAAEETFKVLEGKKIGDKELVVDFVGEKSKNIPAKPRKLEAST